MQQLASFFSQDALFREHFLRCCICAIPCTQAVRMEPKRHSQFLMISIYYISQDQLPFGLLAGEKICALSNSALALPVAVLCSLLYLPKFDCMTQAPSYTLPTLQLTV
jgi:hypothetical protein